MKIGIDARFITSTPRRGIGTYSINLLNNLFNSFPGIDFYLYTYIADIENVLPISNNVFIKRLPIPTYPIWEQIALPLAVYRDNIDILHCVGNTAPIFILGKTRLIITLHDVMFLQSGAFIPMPVTVYQKLGRLYRSIIVPFVARKSKALITVSEFSKFDILNLIPGTLENRVTVTYEGCDPAFTTDNTNFERPTTPFILSLGANDPRKNTLLLVKAFLKLIEDVTIPHNLVIVGYKNWEGSASYKEVLNSRAAHRITFLPFITTAELAHLYSIATVFVYPSLYEGFGIPLLEAFNMRCPVIASSSTSIPEVGGDAPEYFDPNNVAELTEKMLNVIQDSSLRNAMIQRGVIMALKFNWDSVATRTVAVYQKVYFEMRSSK